jgi:chemotaxis protein MotB
MPTDIQPIIVKRKKVIAGGHHGGAWKIAYADFVTAMMAFFLLMWLLSSIEVEARLGIAEYFKTPLSVALSGSGTVGNSVVPLKGGGKDFLRKTGEVSTQKEVEQVDEFNSKKAKAALAREESNKMQAMKRKLEDLIETDPKLSPYKKQLLIDITTEGLRVQVVDEKNRPMFALSSAELEPSAKMILQKLASTFNGLPNKISLSGHTDAKPFPEGTKNYSNWELSSDRALEARRVLVAGGMDESRLIRVIGLSSSVLLDQQDPLNPINRRISIIVLNKRAELAATSEGSQQAVDAASLLPPGT